MENMNLVVNEGNWDILKNKLKKLYPELTDSDLHHEEGMEESMLRLVETKLRKTKEELREIIERTNISSPEA